MKPRSRKAFAAVALVAGLALVFFEARRFDSSGPNERWFWLLVGSLVVVLSGIELLSGKREPL